MYCEKCGKEIGDDVEFCKFCGLSVKSTGDIVESIKKDFSQRLFDTIPSKLRSIESNKEYSNFVAKAEGDLEFIKGNYDEAYKIYSKVASSKRDWDTNFNMGLIDLNKSRTKDAIANFENVDISKRRKQDTLLYNERYENDKSLVVDKSLYLGILYKNEGMLERSLECFKEIEELGVENELVYANMGDIYFKEDNYEDAIHFYRKAIKCSTDDYKKSGLLNDLGLAFFRSGLTTKAISSFKEAIILNSDNKNAVYNLGVIYVKSGMQEKVKDDYKEFLKHEGGVDIVYNLSKSIMNVAKQEILGEVDIDFIGESQEMRKVKEIIAKAAAADSTVFIHGDNGTGKELAARAVHQLSKRAEKPFIVVNCGALPETLLESELFGYEKGAFTGAVKAKLGRFEIANGGTIFLDEIGDINQAMQVKLLRFVQEREFESVGGTETKKVDVRIIAATNRDIHKLVADGIFREDLYYRLYVLPVVMPPLRERGRDIKLLAEFFLEKYSEKYEKDFKTFSKDAVEVLLNYSWPGNVRQLENIIERTVTLHDGFEVKKEYLPDEIIVSGKRPDKFISEETENNEEMRVINALKSVNYSRTKAAEKLGISRVALWKKMKKMNIG